MQQLKESLKLVQVEFVQSTTDQLRESQRSAKDKAMSKIQVLCIFLDLSL